MFSPIAIVGRACLLPGASSADALWDLVREGRSAVAPAPEGRWRIAREIICSPDKDAQDRAWSDHGGYIRDFRFDPHGFAVSPVELEGLDPLVLWALQTAREALHDAGDERADALRPRTGAVFGNLSFPSSGMSAFAEATWYGDAGISVDSRNRFMSSGPAAWLDQALNLGVASFCLDAACASSLYAIKLACDRLHDGTADRMLAGAINRADSLFIHVGFTALQALSRTGQSRPFHADADGLIPAEGAGFVVLKRLKDAERDGDVIHGVIRGVGLSNDGRGRGLLVPSAEGQTRAIQAAYAMSGVDPNDVSLLECHATGTPIGDGIELKSSAAVFDGPLPIGSLKSNLGHSVTVAGVAGLIKVLEAMRHGQRPPTIGADRPLATLKSGPFRLLQTLEAWPDDRPRIAGVSAFGFGGNNAHLIVEQHHPNIATPTAVTHKLAPIAIVGIGAIVGPAAGRTAVADALLKGTALTEPTESIQLGLMGLKFPPNDLKQALGQQIMMLEAAREAANDAGGLPTGPRTGVLVGMEADPEVARYGARWRRGDQQIIDALQSGGVLGTMPNVVANRLSSQFDAGGPGYTVSAGEASGTVALKTAIRALRTGEIDVALVGAVDLSSEPVHQAAGGHSGDAAVALVLRRQEDVESRIYALIDHGEASNADLDRFGRPFAATALLHTTLGALALHHRTTLNGRPWLLGRAPRGIDLGGMHLSDGDAAPAQTAPRLRCFSGADRAEVLAALHAGRESNDGPCRVVLVATDAELDARIKRAVAHIKNGAPAGIGVHFREAPIEGQIAAVFTGAGAAYHGMGQGLLQAAPVLADRLQRRFKGLDEAWDWAFDPAQANARASDLDQLWGSSALCQLHAELSLDVLKLPIDATIGYSSGETNALFALGVWTDLDQMIADSIASELFTRDLGGRFEAVAQAWEQSTASWASWAVLAPLEVVRDAIGDAKNLHIAIIHAPGDYVVAGDAKGCDRLVDRIGRTRCVRLGYELAVHVPELDVVRDPWLRLHTRAVTARPDVRVYGNGMNGRYTPSPDACAQAILGQANDTLDFGKTIEQAWADGVRVFVEHGPQGHCARWIQAILGDREALVVSLDRKGKGVQATLDAVAALVAAGIPIKYHALQALMSADYSVRPEGPTLALPAHPPVVVPTDRSQFMAAPKLPTVASSRTLPANPVPDAEPMVYTPEVVAQPAPMPVAQPAPQGPVDNRVAMIQQHMASLEATQSAYVAQQTALHEQFLALRKNAAMAFAGAMSQTKATVRQGSTNEVQKAQPHQKRAKSTLGEQKNQVLPEPSTRSAAQRRAPQVLTSPEEQLVPPQKRKPIGPSFSRAQLETHASGRISDLFGDAFRSQDQYAIQVRMPEPPMLLADRITGIDAEPTSMGTGTIWTETDVSADSWYLHAGHMPAGIMIESGQADLMLISWLGIDLLNQGQRAYRLLGCELTYHGDLPCPGETLSYDIHIDGHANDGDVRLMFFHYDCQVSGESRLSVRGGQAGFFTKAELAKSAGCLWSPQTQEIVANPRLDPPDVRCEHTQFDTKAVRAFADGRPWECFGAGFDLTKTHTSTPRISNGRMLFLDHVTDLTTDGGPWGRGYLRAETQVTGADWYFDGHFKNDPCMPGTLMFEGCLQAMSFYMASMGFTTTRDGWRFAPVPEEAIPLSCRGQVIPTSQNLVYEIFVEEVIAGPVPTVYADLLCTVDGLKAFYARRVGLRLVPGWPIDAHPVEIAPDDRQTAVAPDGFRFDYKSLLACAWGRPSEAFGSMYTRFDAPGRVARLPGPPYHFLSRITRVEGPIGGMEKGTMVEVAYDVPPDVWYFDENGNRTMPFAVLLEAALQPCGWLASYVGSALTAEHELCFRNLDGTGNLLAEIVPDSGTLRTISKLTSISATAGMIIESFVVQCLIGDTVIYEMDTVFGFFPVEALENQVGLATTDAQHALLTEPCDLAIVDLTQRTGPWFAPGRAKLSQPMLLMLDRITGNWPNGGAHGAGRMRAEKTVDPGEWFFKAHFFQDPVQPGSLGIEAMIQLLQIFMLDAGMDDGISNPRFEALALGKPMTWKYRGQVIPKNKLISTTLDIVETGRDEQGTWAIGEASLWVDGKRIYEASNIGMRIVAGDGDDGLTLDPKTDTWLGDHRPTYTVPALPMMSIVDLLAQGSQGAGQVIGLRDVRIAGWVILDRARTVETQCEGDRVRLLIDGSEAASARVIRGDYAIAPHPMPALTGEPVASPYQTGALFHGPAFQILDSHVMTAQGSSSVLQAKNGVPTGLLNPGLLDGSTHAIPHDELHQWHPQVSPDMVAYPAWIPEINFYGATPTEGTVRCEVRPDGIVGTPDFPAHQIQLITDNGIWASLRLVEACFPKGPLGSAPRAERRAFLRDHRFTPGVSLSTVTSTKTTLSYAQVQATDWLPGTVQATFGTTDPVQIAIREHIGAAHQLHPSVLPAALPLTHFELNTTQTDDSVTVTGDGQGSLDLTQIKDFWTQWFARERWPVEDLYYGLAQRFIRRVVLQDPAGLNAIKGRSTLYLANHQTGVESLVFSIIASGLNQVPTVTLAKAEHRHTWLGRLIELCFRYPGVRDPKIITFFERDDPTSLPGIIGELATEMAGPGRSVMVHIEGTRALSCRAPVQKMSGAFIDMALKVGAPIVPIRFVGGLPVDPLETRLEFPVGMGQQDIYFGTPLMPEMLGAMPYGERKKVVIDAINSLGVTNDVEQPLPGDPAFESQVKTWLEQTNSTHEDAVLGCILAEAADPTDGIRRLLAREALTRSAEDTWLAELGKRLHG